VAVLSIVVFSSMCVVQHKCAALLHMLSGSLTRSQYHTAMTCAHMQPSVLHSHTFRCYCCYYCYTIAPQQGNLRFLHTRGALKSLRALSTLGAEHAFLWPKYAAGRTFCTNMLDALLGTLPLITLHNSSSILSVQACAPVV
jgi:hypothetical protein